MIRSLPRHVVLITCILLPCVVATIFCINSYRLHALGSPVEQISKESVDPDFPAAEAGHTVFRIVRFSADHRLDVTHESVPIALPGTNEVTGPNSHQELHLVLDSPRVYQQQYAKNDQYPIGIRHLTGVDPEGNVRWTRPLCIDHGPPEAAANTRLEYLQLAAASDQGIIITATRPTYRVIVIDPVTGAVIEEAEIATAVIDNIYGQFLAYDRNSRTLYAQAHTSADASLIAWNLQTNTETRLLTLAPQALTGIEQHIDSVLLLDDDQHMVLTTSLPSRLNSRAAYLVFDHKQKTIVHQRSVYKWGRPALIAGKERHFGVSWGTKDGRTMLVTCAIVAPATDR